LQGELFTGYLPERKVIQELYAPVFAPKQRWVDVESVTEHPEVTNETVSESETWSNESRTDGYSPDGLLFRGDTSGYSISGLGRGSGTNSSSSTTPAHETRTRSREFITEYEERSVLTSRQLETLEDLKENCRERIMRQPRQHCIVQLQHEPPTPIKVADVFDAPVSDRSLELYKRLIYRAYPTGQAIDLELDTRVETILEKEKVINEPPTRTTTLKVPKTKKSPAPPAKRRKPRNQTPSDHKP
jgi:hypothetical protein